jgi:hypothetical protein
MNSAFRTLTSDGSQSGWQGFAAGALGGLGFSVVCRRKSFSQKQEKKEGREIKCVCVCV